MKTVGSWPMLSYTESSDLWFLNVEETVFLAATVPLFYQAAFEVADDTAVDSSQKVAVPSV